MTISKMYGTAVKKILLIGDSIRMGYCRFVRELMQGEAEVFYPEDNCRFAQYTLRGLQDWQAQLGLWNGVDLIHWNNGLWDVGHLGIGATGEAEAARPIAPLPLHLWLAFTREGSRAEWEAALFSRRARSARDRPWAI